ncbi:HD domain-containing protein [Bacteroidales bacterium]|nr:HD domain-containing protein [Bacteroidales bacterium]
MQNTEQENKELVKRIAKLANTKKQLLSKIKEYEDKIEDLTLKNEHQKQIIKTHSLPTHEDVYEEPLTKVKTQKINVATILYAGIHGSTLLADNVDTQGMMDDLDKVFIGFESILEKYKIYKTKSIGDTFVGVGGVWEQNTTNPIEVVLAALEMKNLLFENMNQLPQKAWDIRFGIHTGSVSVSISGNKRKHYDVKGDTLNIASRMEGWSDSGKINISAMTYELVKEFFNCEYYGKMPVRYKGNLQMYNVKGILNELSANGKGIIPNENFWVKYALIRFSDLQEFILDKLEKELPEHLYYHNVKHTVDVTTQVELIGWGEGISDEEILLLKTAALFHDAGHIIDYSEHEYHGTVLAREYLPKYNYTQTQIDHICELIMVTKLPPTPQNTLENIMCDADLDYLGRSDMIPVSGMLYKELRKENKIGSLNDWNKLQIKFISSHQYFTKTARNLREVNKQKQIDRIKKLIV